MENINSVVVSEVDEVIEFFSAHNHTEFSNERMRDSINKVEDLIDRAYELGYKGVAITDHEALSGAVRAISHYYKNYADTDFKVVLGDEMYLVDDIEDLKENGGKYNHCATRCYTKNVA